MKVHEKIKQVRKEKKMSRKDLYQKLADIFGKEAIKPNTIWRIESGLTAARTSSLRQLCLGLGVGLKDILTDIEPESRLVSPIKKDKRLEQYVYNEKVLAEILTPPQRKFLVEELSFSPQGETNTEEDPIEVGKFEKWVYCLSGEITCLVGAEKHILKKGDCLSFESNMPHAFQNSSSRKSRCLIVQNPRHV